MVRPFIRSWSALYDMLGFHEADDPDGARSIIVTSVAQRNTNVLLDSSNSYVYILLNTYFTTDHVRNELEVVHRLGGVLPSAFVEGLSIDVIWPSPRPTPCAAALVRPWTVLRPWPTQEVVDNSRNAPAVQTIGPHHRDDVPHELHREIHHDNIQYRVKAECHLCHFTTWSQYGVGHAPYDELAIRGWYKRQQWRKTLCPDCCCRYYASRHEPAHEPSLSV